jgi:quinol monooxygenase YgiN
MQNTPLTIVAKILAKATHRDLVKRELLKLIPPTLKEKGCINYDLHQDHENKNLFLFYENWENRTLWQTHMNSMHINAYAEATKDAVEDFVLHEMIN